MTKKDPKKAVHLNHEQLLATKKLGAGDRETGIQKIAAILAEVEAIASSVDKNLEEVLNLIPFALKSALRDWDGIQKEQKIVNYLLKKSAEGDTEAEELYQLSLLNSAELITEELVDEKTIKIKDSYIV